MRLALDRHRLVGRARDISGWTLLEAALIALVAIQCARLAWTLVTPVGPVGDWRPGGTEAAPVSPDALASFDPFFRLSGEAGPVAVTALNLKLHGIREDRATGRGSAIIATPDGRQRSYAVGDEIAPGVTLKAVAFDHVTISRGGASEQLFMDQSGAAPQGAPAAPVTAAPFRSPPMAAPPPMVSVPAPPPREAGR